MNKSCTICGTVFKCSPSDKKVTCSDTCWRERARRAGTTRGRKWQAAAKEKLSQKGQTDNLKKGTLAALKSPVAGPFETNKQALIWTIVSPEGIINQVKNLRLWVRQNADMLPGTPEQAYSGFMQIKRSMLGKTRRTVNQWKGWQLLDWRKP